jgi:hypothetical protein
MKKITDERLIVKNLKNIRIAYILQTLGIIGILAYDAVTKGLDRMHDNPLWLVFMITTVISGYLSMSISVEHENVEKSPKKNLGVSIIVLLLISTVLGFLVSKSAGYTFIDGVICGGILFICGIFPTLYVFKLRKKQQDEHIDK